MRTRECGDHYFLILSTTERIIINAITFPKYSSPFLYVTRPFFVPIVTNLRYALTAPCLKPKGLCLSCFSQDEQPQVPSEVFDYPQLPWPNSRHISGSRAPHNIFNENKISHQGSNISIKYLSEIKNISSAIIPQVQEQTWKAAMRR